jgi:hypothetical protein
LLLEVDRWTGFAEDFSHLKNSQPAKNRTLLLTVILADTINLGLNKMAEACPGTSIAQLSWLSAQRCPTNPRDGEQGNGDTENYTRQGLIISQRRQPVVHSILAGGGCSGQGGNASLQKVQKERLGTKGVMKRWVFRLMNKLVI